METVLITGANRGLGLTFVNAYLKRGAKVHAVCRDPSRVDALSALLPNDQLQIHTCDVGDETQIIALKEQLADNPIDILINNAGIYGNDQQYINNLSLTTLQQVFNINAFAPALFAHHFISNLRAGQRKLLVNITSRMGSIADNESGGKYAYRGSKAALNCIMHSLAQDVEPDGVRVLLLHPGWVKTDMGGENALLNSDESIEGMLKIIDDKASQSGGFYHSNGEVLPW